LQSSANLWQVGVGAAGPIFSGGRIKGEIRQAKAKQQQLLNDYLSTIQTAFREVDDSLVTIQKLRELLEIEARHISALKDYAYFARSRYDVGYSNYIVVLDSERNLYAAEIRYVQTQNDIFAAIVSIYKAMGGGWVMKAAQQIVLPSQKSAGSTPSSKIK
jgi:multidrug efflux system outer membrane protein